MDPYRTRSDDGDEPARSLLHRWFVQYNPMYLASAMLVLAGVILTSRGLVREGSTYGPLVVALIAEVYACALIGGAALLTRIGQRRAAVLLALITIVYQGDLTLHTETCAYLGAAGIAATIAWLAFFVGKLYGLAWALRLRIAPRAVATASLGAVAIAIGPFVLPALGARATGAALAIVLLALGVVAPRAHEDAAVSLVPLDAWGTTVLRRCVRAAWAVWAVLGALHLQFWSGQWPIVFDLVVPALVCVAAARMRSEGRAAALTTALLAVTLLIAPDRFTWCSLFVALALASRMIAPSALMVRVRAAGSALASLAIAAWSWPFGARVAEHVPRPRSMVAWGVTALSLGFVLLGIALMASWKFRRAKVQEPMC
jgi:hypothetical protein